MTTYKILSNDEWIVGIPSDGELCREMRGSDSNEHYLEYIYQTPTTPIDIVITGITGALTYAPDFSSAIIYEEEICTVTGSIAWPDGMITVPIRNNNGVLKVFLAIVTNNTFSLDLYFKDSGNFIYSNNECNLDLPPNTFDVAPIKFDVLAKIPAA